MTPSLKPLLSYLEPLEEAVRELANTWRPNDPQYQADVYLRIRAALSRRDLCKRDHGDKGTEWHKVLAELERSGRIRPRARVERIMLVVRALLGSSGGGCLTPE